MAMRMKAGLWLAAGLVACVATGWALRERHPDSHRTRVASDAATPPTTALRLLSAVDVVGKQQPIKLDAAMARAAMRDGTLRVALPDGTTYPVKTARQETDAFGQWSVIGHVDTPVGAQSAVLTFGGDAVFGMVPMPDGRMLRIVTNHGEVLASLDGGLIPPGHGNKSDIAPRPREDLVAVKAKAAAARGMIPHRPAHVAGAGQTQIANVAETVDARMNDAPLRAEAAALPLVTITVLAAYSDDLIALRGSEAAVQTELSNLVAAANQAHIDSGTRVRFSLVRKQKLNVAATMDNYDVLYQMTADFVDGVDLETVRDQYSADLVTFVRPYRDTYSDCGIAWVGGSGNYGPGTESIFGFSVVDVGPCGAHVMAHELGHNLGSAHDRETDWIDGEYPHASYPYAFGYRRLVAPTFATIMAYTADDEPWIGRFSDPRSTGCGAPCGVANLSDNVRAFDRMAQAIADFRTAPGKMTISDSEAWEPDPGTGVATIFFPIRTNAYAMDAAIPWQVQVVGGTATPGVDFQVYDGGALSGSVPWGYRNESLTYLHILPDTEIEGDETIILRLTAPGGYPIADDTAVLTIRDDDPRPHLRGRFIQQPGEPDGYCYMHGTVWGLNGPRDQSQDFGANVQDCTFDFAVAPGANVALHEIDHVEGPWEGYRFLPTIANDVYRDRYIDIAAPMGVLVTVVAWPTPGEQFAGDPIVQTRSVESWMGRTVSETSTYGGVGTTYRRWVYPGATIEMAVELPYQYRPWYGVLQNVRKDTTVNVTLRNAGTLAVRGGQAWPEGRAGRTTKVPVQVVYIEKSGVEPQLGLVKVNWHTVDGTAKAGKDYVAASGTVTITGTEPSAIAWIDVIGNDIAQKARTFDVVIDPVSPYNITNASTRVTIADDDRATGGPAQKTAGK